MSFHILICYVSSLVKNLLKSYPHFLLDSLFYIIEFCTFLYIVDPSYFSDKYFANIFILLFAFGSICSLYSSSLEVDFTDLKSVSFSNISALYRYFHCPGFGLF